VTDTAHPSARPAQGAGSLPAAQRDLLAVDFSLDFKAAKEALIATFEKEYLSRLLTQTGGNVSAAARRAAIDRKHFIGLLRRHGLK
jgi:transcriptional regulator of acetoin/glycerol metabolism